MKDPLGLLAARRPPLVEDERLLHADKGPIGGAVYLPVLSGGLPIAGPRRPVRSQPRRILPVAETVEVPLPLSHLCRV